MSRYIPTAVLILSLAALAVIVLVFGDGSPMFETLVVTAKRIPANYWTHGLTMALIGTVGTLLLVANKHRGLATASISFFWLPSSLALFTIANGLLCKSTSVQAIMTGEVMALTLSCSTCVLISQLWVQTYRYLISRKALVSGLQA